MAYPSKLHAEQILQEAQTLLEQGGPEALRMRGLAESLGVRASSLYRHFPNREALLRALEDGATRHLQTAIQAAGRDLPPRAALHATAHAYLHYARTHPHLYALLLTPGREATDPRGTAGKALWNTLLEQVGALSGHPDDTDHAVALWTFLHGFVVLERSGLFGASGPRGGLEVGLKALFDQMEGRG